MDARDIGLIMIWIGAIVLVAVLQHRIRRGAWGTEAWEAPPPLERWQVPMAGLGIALAAIGALLAAWGFS